MLPCSCQKLSHWRLLREGEHGDHSLEVTEKHIGDKVTWMTLGKLCNFSELHFLIIKWGDDACVTEFFVFNRVL